MDVSAGLAYRSTLTMGRTPGSGAVDLADASATEFLESCGASAVNGINTVMPYSRGKIKDAKRKPEWREINRIVKTKLKK